MKINVEISAQDLANVSRKNLDALMAALQGFACDETSSPVDPVPTMPAPAPMPTPDPDPDPDPAPAPVKEQDTAPESKKEVPSEAHADVKEEKPAAKEKKTSPKASHKTAVPKSETKEEAEETEPAEETPEPEETSADEADADAAEEVDREMVQSRLKEIAASGKSKEIKSLLKSYNIKKFSDLPDDKLSEVLEKAEAL